MDGLISVIKKNIFSYYDFYKISVQILVKLSMLNYFSVNF